MGGRGRQYTDAKSQKGRKYSHLEIWKIPPNLSRKPTRARPRPCPLMSCRPTDPPTRLEHFFSRVLRLDDGRLSLPSVRPSVRLLDEWYGSLLLAPPERNGACFRDTNSTLNLAQLSSAQASSHTDDKRRRRGTAPVFSIRAPAGLCCARAHDSRCIWELGMRKLMYAAVSRFPCFLSGPRINHRLLEPKSD